MKIDQDTAMFCLECLRSDVLEDRIEPYHLLTKAHYEAAILWAEHLIDNYEPILEKNKHEEIIKGEVRLRAVSELRDNIKMVLDDMDETAGHGIFEDGFNYAYKIILVLIDETLEKLAWEDTAARDGI